jgi:hypothetical protein
MHCKSIFVFVMLALPVSVLQSLAGNNLSNKDIAKDSSFIGVLKEISKNINDADPDSTEKYGELGIADSASDEHQFIFVKKTVAITSALIGEKVMVTWKETTFDVGGESMTFKEVTSIKILKP